MSTFMETCRGFDLDPFKKELHWTIFGPPQWGVGMPRRGTYAVFDLGAFKKEFIP